MIREGLKRSGRDVKGYRDVLDSADENLALPWKSSYFEDAEKRRIISGVSKPVAKFSLQEALDI